jgi:hypothetical protein
VRLTGGIEAPHSLIAIRFSRSYFCPVSTLLLAADRDMRTFHHSLF